MRKWMFLLLAGALLAGIIYVWRSESSRTTPAGSQATPAAEAPAAAATTTSPMMGNRPPNMPDAEGPFDDQPVALRLAGMNSAEELQKDLTRLKNAESRSDFETAYRLAFSARQAQRNYPEAMRLAQQVIGREPAFAPAHRVLGYTRFNTGDPDGALASYKKAVEIDPNYGEGQYALAFMYAMSDAAAGAVHFKKAMALGVKDEREIGPRYFGINP